MIILRLIVGLCLLFLFSCTAEQRISGIYQSANSGTQLILNTDSSFEWIYPGSNAIEIGTSHTPRNLFYFTGGKWSMDRDQLILIPSSDRDMYSAELANDSISRFTSISSFNFWNRYGEQVNIRAIKLPKAGPKPHFGNTLYFFAQDFHRNDTLVFYLDGYKPFTYPGSVPGTIGDNIHKITLYEPYHPAGQTVIRIRGRKLYTSEDYYVRKR